MTSAPAETPKQAIKLVIYLGNPGLTVAAVWIAWRAVEDWWQVKCATVAAVAAYLLVVCMSVRPGLCQRPALHDFAWQAYAIAIRAGDKVVVPINPVSWHFVVETPH